MPPSPALRYSPGGEPRAYKHKRGRSLEAGLIFREKDDDLALFNEMQSRERENFLLQSSDDFEETFSSKLKHFPDFKLGISIPVRGESSELLKADGEKNDYDWLLTPPDTPLFPSLDDEPPQVNVAQRGRPRSQPISISRSSTMDTSHRSSRGSASPNRLSPSPRSGNSTFQSRGRPSSAPHTSPTPSLRPSTPARRSSPPPSKSSTPAPRSSTPTPRRMSTGSGGSMALVRGTSPIRTSRGNSASPKIRAWQSNIPGFSSAAPPNLRTSLADRPASYVRGSSPASRNGRDLSSKFGRQSMSPTASRSVSSSHSHDRDRFSSHSKGSIASSGDDDVDSLQSIPVGSLDRLASKRVGAFPSNRALAFSKKSARVLSPSSAPKRSFESVIRQMDHRKSPQNMFRPLLSSVPSSTFYVGKASSAHRSVVSRNSSVTTSSNASSDQGTSVAHDTEGSDHHQDDMASESGKVLCPDIQEEVFAFDKADALNKDVEHQIHDRSLHIQLADFNRDPSLERDPGDSEEYNHHDIDMEQSSASDALCVASDFSEVDSFENTKLCSKCGCRYRVIEPVEGDFNLCLECSRQDNCVTNTPMETAIVVSEKSPMWSTKTSEESKPFNESELLMPVPESMSHAIDKVETCVPHHEQKLGQTTNDGQNQIHWQENSLTTSVVEGSEPGLANPQGMKPPTVGCGITDNETGGQQLQLSIDQPNLKVDISEGAGISVLLRMPSSSKGPVLQGRTFIASVIPHNDLSYARDSANSLRSSFGHGSASASSSVDFSSSRQMQRQLSGRRSDIDYRYDVNAKPQSIGSSSSVVSNHAHQLLGLAITANEENFEVSAGDTKYDEAEEASISSQVKVLASENKEVGDFDSCLIGAAVTEDNSFVCNERGGALDTSTSALPCHTVSIQLQENLVSSRPNNEDFTAYENGEGFPDNSRGALNVGASAVSPESSIEVEHTRLNTSIDGWDIAEVPSHCSLPSISEIEIENCCQSSADSQNDDISTNEFLEPSVPTHSEKDMACCDLELNTSDHIHGVLEEATVMVECRGGSRARSLTLEEATDAILFCSSIVHDLAYQAATIAIETESSVPLEGSKPKVTILGKSNTDRKDPRGRTAGKRSSRSLKTRQRRVETDAKLPTSKTENDENVEESLVPNVGLPNKGDTVKPPPKLESKCNCSIM